jgi:hypothetical protein
MSKYPIIGGLYRHYKGGLYEVISMATHTETNEVVVVYKSIHFGSVHVRPLSSWNGEGKNTRGQKIKRFVFEPY